MKFRFILAAILVFSNNMIIGGFGPGTLVKTVSGWTRIEDLKVKDLVESFDFKQPIAHKIIAKKSNMEKGCIRIFIGNENIIASRNQKFYLPLAGIWKEAKDLKFGDVLLKNGKDYLTIKDISELETEVEIFYIAVSQQHNFFVSQNNILAHNFAPVVLGLSFALGKGIEFLGATFSILMLGGAVGISLFKNKSRHNDAHFGDYNISIGSPSPEDPDEFNKKHPNGKYIDAPYHHKNSWGKKSKAPKNGQTALDNSVPISDNSPNRIGISEGEFVVLDMTSKDIYHGHVRAWKNLTDKMQGALREARMVNYKGKIL